MFWPGAGRLRIGLDGCSPSQDHCSDTRDLHRGLLLGVFRAVCGPAAAAAMQ